jgi:hypothetical protein
VINLVPGAAGYADAISGKARVERSRAGSLVVADIEHEIVLNDVIAAAVQIDSDSRPGFGVVVVEAADLVFLDCVGADRAEAANAHGTICGRGRGAGGNPTFHIDDIAADGAGVRALRRDAAGIDLVHGACGWVADQVVFNQETREHGGGRALNSYSSRGCCDVVVLDGQIICRRPGANGRANRSNWGRSSSGRGGCLTASQEPISCVFRSDSGCSGADVPPGRATNQVQVLNGVVVGVIVAGCCQRDADHLTISGRVSGCVLNRQIPIGPRRVGVIAVDGHIAGAVELHDPEAAARVAADRDSVVDRSD